MRSHLDVIDIRTGRITMGNLTHVEDRPQRWQASSCVPRHRHTEAYATLVLNGGLQECGSRGRIEARAGHVLVHGAFDAHLDRIFIVGAETLNLKVPAFGCIADALCEISDVDLIVRTAETDPAGAAALLLEQMSPRPITPQDWPDLLAADLIEDPNRRLNDWADSHGLSRETISRGFGQIFGIPPAVFRSEVRSQRAFEQIVEGTNVLSRVLEVSGYSGLPQLSRAVRNLTGATPKSWLLKTSFKSDSFG